ncbi:uncharacterized protein N7482_001984 [Penicillium canariense]|uniref:DUF7703 domain-containing protein n=1 Tax=Penicillium canariense TaxID=189055 RepID=A0A9W9IGP4_9EURO|nr:uncharacterized protein N7482_001984 [Penicillium canariense]KAJ5176107.1 hypothetical protein N7482_001984 [Penicillium canariense]
MAGETGPLHISRALAMVIASLLTLACWNVLEISLSILSTFRRYNGLYFWSMVIATAGILLHAITSFLRYFSLAPNFPMCILVCIGWYAMVTGQSVVLYSRLHLVTTHDRYPRWILYMIVFNFCVLHIPTTVLFLGSNNGVDRFVAPFNIYERIQLAGFAIQETIISALYVWETSTSLRPVLALKGPRGKRVIMNVIVVNIIAILLDASLLTTEYTNHFDVQTTYKPVVYSIKLLLEFTVLNSLLAVIRTPPSTVEDVSRSRSEDFHIRPLPSRDNADKIADPERVAQSDRRGSSRESFLRPHDFCLACNHHVGPA